MPSRLSILFSVLLSSVCLLGQVNNYPYVVRSFAGSLPAGLGDGGPATAALLLSIEAAVPDSQGNLYILDSGAKEIRKAAIGGNIDTVASGVPGYNMILSGDGNFYVAANAQVFEVSPSGSQIVVAGTGMFGTTGDEIPAVNAQLQDAFGLALDGSGNLYFTDGNRIREVTRDGIIHTIAGTTKGGYSGDSGPAAAALLNQPRGVVVDKLNNVYISDGGNRVVRRVSASGTITTFAGNGSNFGSPSNGPATATSLGSIVLEGGIAVDASNNVYVGSQQANVVMEITPAGNLTIVAGNGSPNGPLAAGSATGLVLSYVQNVSVDAKGNLFIADYGTNRALEVSGGQASAVAGTLHYGGDNGTAVSALINQPAGFAMDAQGNAYIADAGNYRIRKVSPGGTITTYAGNGSYGAPVVGGQATLSPLQLVGSLAVDSQGAVYFAEGSSFFANQVFKITAAGVLQLVAGVASNVASDTGDGGPATKATFGDISSIVCDSSGNVYIADNLGNQVRKVSAADGTISNFAGSAQSGYGGDGQAATGAKLSRPGGLAIDGSNNIYIADTENFSIRMVSPGGTISTVVGNGTTLGTIQSGQPASSPFAQVSLVAVDNAGNLYAAFNFTLYKISGGTVTQISGAGTSQPVAGIFASAVSDVVLSPVTPAAELESGGLSVDANGDLYYAGRYYSSVWKLVLDSPSGLTTSGDEQTGQVGWTLPNPLQVIVNGRAGVPVPAVPVNFAVSSGDATLSAASAVTDATGSASVQPTLGATAGKVVVTAMAAGTSLAPVQFNLTTIAALPGGAVTCTISEAPSITSVNSLSGFGGFSYFAPGSWLEVHGSNLAVDARTWSGSDFQGANAPISLDGTSISIDGNAGFMEYISGGQIDVQAPADSATGPVKITVTTCAGTSAPITIQEAALAPGMLAPASFHVGGKQYLVALFQDGVTYVGNSGLIPGVPFRPASPGDVIAAYGIGFGPVTPASVPGLVVGQQNSLPNVTLSFGSTPATFTYAGLAPGVVGLYQFDITVPQVAPGDYPISVVVDGVPVPQSLFLTVQ